MYLSSVTKDQVTKTLPRSSKSKPQIAKHTFNGLWASFEDCLATDCIISECNAENCGRRYDAQANNGGMVAKKRLFLSTIGRLDATTSPKNKEYHKTMITSNKAESATSDIRGAGQVSTFSGAVSKSSNINALKKIGRCGVSPKKHTSHDHPKDGLQQDMKIIQITKLFEPRKWKSTFEKSYKNKPSEVWVSPKSIVDNASASDHFNTRASYSITNTPLTPSALSVSECTTSDCNEADINSVVNVSELLKPAITISGSSTDWLVISFSTSLSNFNRV